MAISNRIPIGALSSQITVGSPTQNTLSKLLATTMGKESSSSVSGSRVLNQLRSMERTEPQAVESMAISELVLTLS